ncbi:hypothetical protein [Nocardioides sp.]|uniref:RCC1 domain-containing protein n=1 Tax=Nocardioides sp. TaxID=35761 RepID=UPI003566BCF1
MGGLLVSMLAAAPSTAAPITAVASAAKSEVVLDSVERASAGGEHGCGIREPGTLWCWGRNTFGQLGIGTKGLGPVPPTQVGGKTDWTQVSAGGSTTCAVRGPGRLYCWGLNHRGQVGDGGKSESTKPKRIKKNGSFKSVSVAWYHACGVRTDNTLVCWGDNSFGQIGRGNTKQDRKIHKVKGRWRSVSTSGWNTCGVKVSGKLKCWGRNLFGQLGTGKSGDASKPTVVAKETKWAEVDLSWTHACGRQTNGVVRCWGRNDQGQVGDGASIYVNSPYLVPGGHIARSIAVAEGTSCLVDIANVTWCWGDDRYDQVGGSGTGSPGIPARRTGSAETVAGGWFHFCADGAQTVCWGNNERGQLGSSSSSEKTSSRTSARVAEKRTGLSFRLASMNVLGNNHSRPFADADHFAPSRLRSDWTAQSLLNNGIDVAGLQEQDAGQLAGILNAAQGRLASFPSPAKGDLRAETAIVWDAQRFTLVKARSVKTRFIRRTLKRPFVRLRDNASGREFWVMNVHNAPWQYQTLRNKATKVQIAKIQKLETKGLPVFYVGDFNEKKTILCKVLRKTGLVSASGGRLTGKGECKTPRLMRVDWIFGSKSVTWSRFGFTKPPLARLSTDHWVPVVDVAVP